MISPIISVGLPIGWWDRIIGLLQTEQANQEVIDAITQQLAAFARKHWKAHGRSPFADIT